MTEDNIKHTYALTQTQQELTHTSLPDVQISRKTVSHVIDERRGSTTSSSYGEENKTTEVAKAGHRRLIAIWTDGVSMSGDQNGGDLVQAVHCLAGRFAREHLVGFVGTCVAVDAVSAGRIRRVAADCDA